VESTRVCSSQVCSAGREDVGSTEGGNQSCPEDLELEDHIYVVTSLWSKFGALARIIA
jgi:hypothetical protein